MSERDESLSGDAAVFMMEITDVHSNDVKKIYPGPLNRLFIHLDVSIKQRLASPWWLFTKEIFKGLLEKKKVQFPSSHVKRELFSLMKGLIRINQAAFRDLITALSSWGSTDEYFQAPRYRTNLQEKDGRMICAVSTGEGDGQLKDK